MEDIMKKKRNRILSLLGGDAEFDGVLKFHGTTRIDGHFKGKILGMGNLIVGRKAFIEATIRVSHILVTGKVHGDVVADKGVNILSTGEVYGNIKATTFVMEEGAIFDGNCKMEELQGEGDEQFQLEFQGQGAEESLPNQNAGTIHGRVLSTPSDAAESLNSQGNESEQDAKKVPIKDAKVFAKCKGIGKRQTKTDSSGYYRLTDLEDGKWKVSVKAKGYEKVEATVRINGGGIHEQNFD